MLRLLLLAIILLLPQLRPAIQAQSIPAANAAQVDAAVLRDEVTDFLTKEVGAHLSDIKSYEPPPDKVFAAGATGEYTWGTFMNAVGAYAALSGKRSLGGRDLAREVGQIGLLEYRLGGTRFSQMYGVLALRHFGTDLNTNPVWQGLSEDERARWRKYLDVSAFYDPKTQQVINLPENYLGVAARIASTSYQLGLLKDRALLDGVITRAARPFLNNGIYSDDAPPTGRFDRYSNEYARFVWEAAESSGRQDILDAVRPSLMEQMRLWWDLVLPDGYGYAWGRSMGVVSFEDTMEIVGFLTRHPEFRPAPLAQLASAYYQSWRWLRHDYNDKTHVLSVFAYGRGNYGYISRDREWQQTTSFFGKAAQAHMFFTKGLASENVTVIPTEIPRPNLSRFVFFRHGERPAGVWLVRQGSLYFTLPITTGTKPGVADYLPAPHGLAGFGNPVEQVYPSLTPFIELADGRVIAATDGADEIEPSADGFSLRAVWRRWALIGGKPGELVDPHITSEVVWRIAGGDSLMRDESLKAETATRIRRWWLAVPSTATRSHQSLSGGWRSDELWDGDHLLVVAVKADWLFASTPVVTVATGDSALGKGARGPLPLHLLYETREITLPPGKALHCQITMRVGVKNRP
jgi:hypothetical protein